MNILETSDGPGRMMMDSRENIPIVLSDVKILDRSVGEKLVSCYTPGKDVDARVGGIIGCYEFRCDIAKIQSDMGEETDVRMLGEFNSNSYSTP